MWNQDAGVVLTDELFYLFFFNFFFLPCDQKEIEPDAWTQCSHVLTLVIIHNSFSFFDVFPSSVVSVELRKEFQ